MRGGKREGAGRPKGSKKENPCQRAVRTLRAFDDEWQVIKEFAEYLKKNGADKAAEILNHFKGV